MKIPLGNSFVILGKSHNFYWPWSLYLLVKDGSAFQKAFLDSQSVFAVFLYCTLAPRAYFYYD